MPVPTIAGLAGSITSGLVIGQVLHSASVALNPLSRTIQYAANVADPNVLPEFTDDLDAHFRGKLSYASLLNRAKSLGIDLPDAINFDASVDVPNSGRWRRIYLAKKPHYSIDLASVLWWRGQIGDEQAREILSWHGFPTETDVSNVFNTPNPLPVSSILDLLNRGQMDEGEANLQLGAAGIGNGADRDLLISLRKQLPSVGDIISLASTDVWTPETVRRLGLDEGYSEDIQIRFAMLGILPQPDMSFPNGVRLGGQNWPLHQWRMHWQPIAPSTAVELFRRFRGDPNRPNTWSEQGTKPFTSEDLNLAYFRAGIPPGYREWITAAAFPPLQRRQVGTLYAAGVLTDEQALSKYQDAGFNEANAKLMVQADKNRRNQTLFRVLGHESVSDVLHAYEIGTMGRDQAAVSLYRIINATPVANVSEIINPTREEIQSAYNEPYIQNALASIDHKSETKLANTRIAVVRRQYLRGQLNIPQATARLISMGIRADRVPSYTALWAAEATLRGKELPASHALKLMRKGLITSDQVATRLLTLGYPQGDVIEMIALTSLDIANDKAKAKQLMARDQAAQQRAHAQAIRAQQQKLKQQQSNLARSASKADLLKWYKLQILPRNVVMRRLEAIGVSPQDAIAALTAVDQAASTKSGKTKQPATGSNGTTGQ